MRSTFATLLFSAVVYGQIAPVPPNPLELVTGVTEVPALAEQRAAAVSLLERAVENHNLHLRNGAPYALNIAFNASASTLYPGGAGTLEESWVSGENWRWTATLGNYSQLQLSSKGAIYGQSSALMPIRLKTLRQAVFAPVLAAPRQATIRTAAVSWNGNAMTCLLLSAGANQQKAAQGRQWYETEYCIDPTSAALQIFSEAPGIYVVYEYANALKFHNRVLPGRISVSENGATVLDAQLTSIADADPSNLSLYVPTAQMVAQGPAPVTDAPERFPMLIRSETVPSNSVIQPTIVHITMDAQGKVQESEALQSGAVSEQALKAVRELHFAPRPQPAGASPRMREAFVNVQFRPAQTDRGPLVY